MGDRAWHDLEEWFHRCAEVEGAERQALLAELAATDAGVHAEVLSMLDAEEGVAPALDGGVKLSGMEESLIGLGPGSRLGPWRVEEEIGSGGMGTVFRAVRDDGQYQQAVAIKVLKGRSSRDLRERFRRERQTMARMDHPNIARLHDAGITDDEIEYFVMELVDGVSIDCFCDEGCLTVDERLRLFETTCRAVHEAHRQFVVHRDLKPSNVLVDRSAQPKLLDFGIAKNLAPDASSGFATRTGQRPMTPQYASPEQIEGGPITAATDVFCLGLLLHHLVAGARPWVTGSGLLHQLERAICEDDPTPPSVAFWASEHRDRIARERSAEPARLRRRLRGELDAVVLMALQRDPDQRYSSAAALADDVRALVERRAISARSPSSVARAARWLRRRGRPLLGALGLAVTITGVAWLARELHKTTRKADAASELATRVEAEVDRQTTRSGELARLMSHLVDSANPRDAGRSAVDAAVLDRAIEFLELGALTDLHTRITMRRDVGECLMVLARWDEAEHHLEVARAECSQLDPDDLERHRAEVDWIDFLWNRGRSTEAIRATELLAKAMEEAPADAQLQTLVCFEESRVHRHRGDLEAFEESLNEARVILKHARPPSRILEVTLQASFGVLAWDQGDLEEAETILRQALATASDLRVGGEARAVLTQANLAEVLRCQGKAQEALDESVASLAAFEELFGPQHPGAVQHLCVIAMSAMDTRDLLRAREALDRAIQLADEFWPRDHVERLALDSNEARLRRLEGDWDSARAFEEELLSRIERVFGSDSFRWARQSALFGGLLVDYRELEEAESILERALAALRGSVGEEHLETARAHANLGRLHWELQHLDDAEAHHHQALATRRLLLEEGEEDLELSLYLTSLVHTKKAEPHEAVELLEEAFNSMSSKRPLNPGPLVRVTASLAENLAATHAWDEAERHLRWLDEHVGTPPAGSAEAQIVRLAKQAVSQRTAEDDVRP